MSDLDNVMLRIGRVVSADRALKVEVRGVDAFSVPGRVVIPNIENFAWLGPNAERMLHGLLDHECGHAKYTEHNLMATAIAEKGEPFKRLFNTLEDAWIERAIAQEWPGARHNLNRKNRWFWQDEKWQESFAKADEWSAFIHAACLYTRGAVTIDEIRAKREDAAKMIESAQKLLDRVKGVRTSRAALGLSREVWDHFGKAVEPPPPPMPGGGAEPEDDGDDGGTAGPHEDEGEEEKPTPPAPSEPEEDESEDESSASDEDDAGGDESEEEGDGGDDADDEPSEAPGAPAEPPPSALPEDLKSKLKDLFDDPSGWHSHAPLNPEEAVKKEIDLALIDGPEEYINFSHEFDHERDFTVDVEGAAIAEPLAVIEHDAHAAGDAFAQAFEVALRAMRYKRPVGGNDEGEVDEQLLAEFSLGAAPADTLYRQFVSEDDRDVVVSIMIDCSGSMGGDHKIGLARRTAAALSMALSRCQVAHEITGFTCASSHDEMRRHRWLGGAHKKIVTDKFNAMRAALAEAQKETGRHPGIYARELYGWGGGWHGGGGGSDWSRHPLLIPMHAVFKSYDLESLAGLQYADGIHENLDGEAVLWQARRLALRPEPRRVMFVLSDGWPAGARDAVDESGFLKRCVERVQSAGIEIYGIGMCSDAVASFYPRHWVAHRMEDLMEIAFGSLVEVLTEGRNESECVRLD